jgi:hypothetical protein
MREPIENQTGLYSQLPQKMGYLAATIYRGLLGVYPQLIVFFDQKNFK